jgi:hypothetical protein
LNTRNDIHNEFKIESGAIEEDFHQERIEVIEAENIVQVKDVQVYEMMDFEFIQRLQQPKRSFILRVYNKLLTNKEMPFL